MPKLFVVMPFGTRAAGPGHGVEVLDFDAVYARLIKPAAEALHWTVRRIDEVAAPGSIEHQYLREIFDAELMIADVSIPNGNVYYELGLRQAISNAGTLLIACRGSQLPFDIATQRVLFYEPTDDGLQAAQLGLIQALRSPESENANPVRAFLEQLGLSSNPAADPRAFQQDLNGRIQRAATVDQLQAVWQWAKRLSPLPVSSLLALSHRLADHGAWTISVDILHRAVREDPMDFEAHRQLAWNLGKLGPGHEDEALISFRKALELNPDDPETLGMLGGLYKRQNRFDQAAECYSRGAAVSPASLYMRVNEAAMALLRDPSQPGAGVSLYRRLLADIQTNEALASDSWSDLVAGEAAFAVGDLELARSYFQRALQSSSSGAIRSALDQLSLLANYGFRSSDAMALVGWVRKEQAPSPAPRSSEQPQPTTLSRSDAQRRLAIIHLSDVHFGSRLKDGRPLEMHRFFDGDYSLRLSHHLKHEFIGARATFRYTPQELCLVISGDLTYGAARDEFKRVEMFLEEVTSELGLSKERIVLAPGNHDVHWPSAQTDRAMRFDNYVSFLSAFYGERLFRQLYPFVTWDFRIDTVRPQPHELVGLHLIDNVLFVAMNSCVYETEQHHYGFVGGRQLRVIEDLIERNATASPMARVAVLHHHLHPFPEPVEQDRESGQIWMDLSTVRDAGLVERRLEKLGFDLVLHGHKHKAQLRETLVRDRNERMTDRGRLIVCGAGSSGVNGLELGSESNHFEVVEILGPRKAGVDFVKIEWRELPLQPDATWITSQRWTITG